MEKNDMQTALDILIKMRQSLIHSLVEELSLHKDEEPSSFTLQDIEDRFAMRMANLNTLIATLQEMTGGHSVMGGGLTSTKIVAKVHEITRNKLQNKLDDLFEYLAPDELLHLSVIPTSEGKFLIIMANGE